MDEFIATYVVLLEYDSDEDNKSTDECQYLSIAVGDILQVTNVTDIVDIKNPQGFNMHAYISFWLGLACSTVISFSIYIYMCVCIYMCIYIRHMPHICSCILHFLRNPFIPCPFLFPDPHHQVHFQPFSTSLFTQDGLKVSTLVHLRRAISPARPTWNTLNRVASPICHMVRLVVSIPCSPWNTLVNSLLNFSREFLAMKIHSCIRHCFHS